ncbi:MAG: SMP-30/gluconolactonase/LRE family protein [Planctomycetes bacterium]|nr:SMP-30/gluconolactonase/LRE family protein [Planctomycetota bacterium]
MPLSQVLIDGEVWQVVSEGHGFTDGLCSDAEGNLYFSDVRSGQVIYKVGLDGKVSEFIKDAAGISGLQWGADGKLYACVARGRMVVRFDKDGKMETLAKEVRPNDLVVTHDGNVYFTQTPEKEICRIDPSGKMTVVSKGVVTKPNGITLSPDQGTLAVSDYGGKYVWAFRIEKDGTLSYPQNYMTMRTPHSDPDVAKGDGMATDVDGRYYVTSAEGLQMYDPTGRMGGVIHEEASRLATRLNDLLYLSELDSGQALLQREEIDLRRLIEGVVARIEPEVTARGATLHVDLADGVTVSADGPKLERALENLLDNARKYTPADGEIRVRSYMEEGSPDYVCVEVANAAPDFSPEELPRLFERFYRSDRTRAGAGTSGSGLGLPIARDLIELHGGTLEASLRDREISFTIRLRLQA